MAAGFDVELPAVPGADDVLALGEAQPTAGLIWRQLLLDARDDLALADRAAVVRAVVLVGEQAVAGAGAAMTRNVGVLLIVALAVEAIRQWRAGRVLLPRLAASACVALGPLAYFAYYADRDPPTRLFYLLIGGMTGWALTWCAIAAWFQMRWSTARS